MVVTKKLIHREIRELACTYPGDNHVFMSVDMVVKFL
jgi:hypothetical protein